MVVDRMLNFCVGILVSILVMGSFAAAQDDSVRKELEAVYAKRDQAIKAKDAEFLKSLLAADYTEKDKDGKIKNRSQAANSLDNSFGAKDPIKMELNSVTKIESVTKGKDANEVIVEISQAMWWTGMLNAQGKAKFRETWMRSDAGWKVRYSVMLDLNMTISEMETAWINYTSAEGRYSVSLPDQPK